MGKILLRLRDNIPHIPFPGCWGTFGGQIEEGETPRRAVIRETAEELNYALTNPVYFGNYLFQGYDIHMFRFFDGPLRAEQLIVKEDSEARFFAYAELEHFRFAFNCRHIVEDYFHRFHRLNRNTS